MYFLLTLNKFYLAEYLCQYHDTTQRHTHEKPSKMKSLVNGCQLLAIVGKLSILDFVGRHCSYNLSPSGFCDILLLMVKYTQNGEIHSNNSSAKVYCRCFQQFVFFQDFNNFPEDMRDDDEAKAELHQRVDVRNSQLIE